MCSHTPGAVILLIEQSGRLIPQYSMPSAGVLILRNAEADALGIAGIEHHGHAALGLLVADLMRQRRELIDLRQTVRLGMHDRQQMRDSGDASRRAGVFLYADEGA